MKNAEKPLARGSRPSFFFSDALRQMSAPHPPPRPAPHAAARRCGGGVNTLASLQIPSTPTSLHPLSVLRLVRPAPALPRREVSKSLLRPLRTSWPPPTRRTVGGVMLDESETARCRSLETPSPPARKKPFPNLQIQICGNITDCADAVCLCAAGTMMFFGGTSSRTRTSRWRNKWRRRSRSPSYSPSPPPSPPAAPRRRRHKGHKCTKLAHVLSARRASRSAEPRPTRGAST